MKSIISTLKFLLILAIALGASFFIHEKYINDTVPGKWYLEGEIIQDTATYTGQYYKVNDSIKLITEPYFRGAACFVYVKEKGEFKRTDIREWWDNINNKYLMIRELQIRYENKYCNKEKYKF
jgi:hypothetical protein